MAISFLGFASERPPDQQVQAVLQRLKTGRRSLLDAAMLPDSGTIQSSEEHAINPATVVSTMFPDSKDVLRHSASWGAIRGSASPPKVLSKDQHILPLKLYQAQQRSLPHSLALRFLRGFLVGLTSRQLVVSMPLLLQNSMPSLDTLLQQLRQSCRWGAFLGAALFLFESGMIFSAGTPLSTSIRSMLSGMISGLSLLFLPKSYWRVVALFSFVRAMEALLTEQAMVHGIVEKNREISPELSSSTSTTSATSSSTYLSPNYTPPPHHSHSHSHTHTHSVPPPSHQSLQQLRDSRPAKLSSASSTTSTLTTTTLTVPPSSSSSSSFSPSPLLRWLCLHWDLVAQCGATSVLVWAFIFKPEALDPAYERTLHLHCGLSSDAMAAIREMALSGQWHLSPPTLERMQRSLQRRGLPPLDPAKPLTACMITHAASKSCVAATIIFFLAASLRSLSALILDQLLPMLVLRPLDFLFATKTMLWHLTMATLRSSLSLSLSALISSSLFPCAISRFPNPCTPFQTVLTGLFCGLPLMIEPASRRREIALFTLVQALTVFTNRSSLWWQLGVFGLSQGLLARAFLRYLDVPALPANYMRILLFLFAPNRNTLAPNI